MDSDDFATAPLWLRGHVGEVICCGAQGREVESVRMIRQERSAWVLGVAGRAFFAAMCLACSLAHGEGKSFPEDGWVDRPNPFASERATPEELTRPT